MMNRVRLKAWLPVAVISVVLLLLRLPSLLEPTWYSDEGTYADIGYALAHGAHLYTDVWDNKPPGVYWLASLFVTRVPAGLGFEVVAFALAATLSLCTWRIGTHLVSAPAGLVAGACVAVLISLPNLEGDLFNAEPAGAAATAAAVLLLVRSNKRHRLAFAGSGAALGVAILFKAVFIGDVAAAAAMVFILSRSRSPGTLWRDYGWLAAGFCSVLGVAALALFRNGSLSAAAGVILSSDTNYVASADNLGGSGSTTWQLVFAALRLLIPLTFAVVVGRRLLRTNANGACIVIWAAYDVAGVWISARGFFHYIQQAEVSLCLLAVLVASAMWHRRFGRALGVVAVLALLPGCEVILWIPRAQTAIADRAPLPGIQQAEAFPIEKLPAYYLDGYQSLFSASAGARFDHLFPTDFTKQQEAVALFRTHTRPGQQVFVWGSIHWAYALGDRMPAGRYVTLNSAYYLDKANEATLLHDIFSHPPAVIIIDAPPPHIVFTFLEEHHYNYIHHAIGGDDYWLAPGEP